MGVGAADRDAVDLAGEHVGAGGAAADVGRAGPAEASVGSMGAAQAEFHNRFAFGREKNARRLGGDEGLVIHEIE